MGLDQPIGRRVAGKKLGLGQQHRLGVGGYESRAGSPGRRRLPRGDLRRLHCAGCRWRRGRSCCCAPCHGGGEPDQPHIAALLAKASGEFGGMTSSVGVVVGQDSDTIDIGRDRRRQRREEGRGAGRPCAYPVATWADIASSMPSVMASPRLSFGGARTIGEPADNPTMILSRSVPALPEPSSARRVMCTPHRLPRGRSRCGRARARLPCRKPRAWPGRGRRAPAGSAGSPATGRHSRGRRANRIRQQCR